MDTTAGWFRAGNSVGNAYAVAHIAKKRNRIESSLADAVLSNARGGLDTEKGSRILLDSLNDLSNSVSTSLDITKYLGQRLTNLLINGTKTKDLEENYWRTGQTLAVSTQGIITDPLDSRVHPSPHESIRAPSPQFPSKGVGTQRINEGPKTSLDKSQHNL